MPSHKELFLLNNAQTSSAPRLLEPVHAGGNYITDTAGKKYIDLVSGFAVSNIGHRHPKVVAAIKDQADRYLHVTVYGEFVQVPQVQFAQKLVSILPATLNSVYFTNSGTEATEGAMKLAKRHTGRTNILACNNSYHGSTQGALSVLGNPYYQDGYGPLLPGIGFIDLNDTPGLDRITEETAAVIVETIQGEAGVRVPDREYMQQLRKRCTETGTLLILDEIQAGLGRTGRLFAFEHFGIVPDILLLAKSLGGGMPIGAFIAPKTIMDSLKDNPILGHITTFGGHPVSCAAGLAALEVLLEEDLIQRVPAKEALFRKLLIHPRIREVRGMGLMLSIQLGSFEEVEQASKLCLEEGVIIDWFLNCETALRVAPPLTITEAEIKETCKKILGVLDRLN